MVRHLRKVSGEAYLFAILQRIVICLTMAALLEEPAPASPVAPGFFSKSFQNFKLSSAAVNRILVLLDGWKKVSGETYLRLPAIVRRG